MKISLVTKIILSLAIATVGIIIIQPYTIPGDIRNQTMLGMAVVLASFLPYLNDLLSVIVSTIKFYSNIKKSE